jgi:probable F420-dependent oxidoreductase
MKFGVTIFPTDYSISPAQLAREVEARGFESLWFPEHSHIPSSRRSPWPGGPELPKMYYDVLDPFVALTAAAAVTERLLVATGICLLVQRDPIQTAKSVASLDQVSGGRFLFGIGGGWNEEEMENHGTDPSVRFGLMRERVEAMKEIWTQDKAEYHGKHVDFEPVMTWPKPIQKPHPPIHVGGAWPQAARRAVRYGNGWMPIAGRGDHTLKVLPEFQKMIKEAGRSPKDLEVSLFGVTPDADEVKRAADAGVTRMIFGLPPADADTVLPILDQHAAVMRG